MKTVFTLLVLALAFTAAPAQAADPCAMLSPIAAPCTALQKIQGVLTPNQTQALVDAYKGSWTHRAAAFQYGLAERIPLSEAPWLGTHNSFNSVHDPMTTVSHLDSNQQLSLTQQLDSDMRSIELDLHVIGGQVLVCHGRGPDELNLGCTNERTFAAILPELKAWLVAHPDQVVLLYLEDEMKTQAGYASAIATLDTTLKDKILKPDTSKRNAKGCTPMPLDITRKQIRAQGKQVLIVGNCQPGWAADVHEWDDTHVESGSTAKYRPFPACDATYARSTYTSKLVRYYEDSTLVATAVGATPSTDPDRITPAKAKAMTDCGVTLFGFDQLLPQDGRIDATIWSWAQDEPKAATGCALMGTDGRWVARPCSEKHRAACANRSQQWSLTTKAVTYAQAAKACKRPRFFGRPETGNSNAELHRIAANAAIWVRYRL